MSLQNRVQPTGEIIATAERGTLMGNRGILHDDRQRLTGRRWQHPHWVTCVLRYKDWHRAVMQPRNYTELFFLDESTAMAAGHRPCGLCRRADFTRFKALFNAANGTATLAQIDRRMHRDRIAQPRGQRRYAARCDTLPDGAFVLHDNAAHLVWQDHLLRYTPAGYTAPLPRPDSTVTILTPAATVATFAQGYRPEPHPTALTQA